MKIEIVAKNYQVAAKLDETIRKKLSKLDKFFEEDTNCKVYLKTENRSNKMEISLSYRGTIIRAEAKAEHFYDAIDLIIPKIEKQIFKHRAKLEGKIRKEVVFEPEIIEEEESFKLVKTKQFELEPMSTEDAIVEFELSGHNFYVYNDKQAAKVRVLYLRDDGNIGMIDPILVK